MLKNQDRPSPRVKFSSRRIRERASSPLRLWTFLIGIATPLAGCSVSGPQTLTPPFSSQTTVTAFQTQNIGVRPSVAADAKSAPAIEVQVVVDKNSILNQEFLYGSDLQYSSIYDKGMDLYNQSIAIGHLPARFRIAGNVLELVSDTGYRFPSDVNHPERLLSRFKILSQTETTLTLSGANSSILQAQLLSAAIGVETLAPQDHWIRSFEFDANGGYLLQQSSVMLADGTIGEFMESIFPRSTLAPSPSFQKFKMDPDDPIGGTEGFVARFRFLPGEKIYEAGNPVAYAEHFDVPARGSIDWYVTRNIPDEYLEPVKLAIEGWNRYFTRGKVLQFKGRLPENIHLGDPRFNVINWDSRLVAGAAYETQAVDPTTGKQSHSLIYLPAAWLKIGMDYWKKGQASDPAPGAKSRRAQRLRVTCSRDLRDAAALLASGRLVGLTSETIPSDSANAISIFGRELLKQTLFHEVGHALGLAHNFKGSLSFDRSNPSLSKSHFSTSIMDYNDYEVERGAFHSVDSANGPSLEYDRQAISALYNEGKDISSADPIVPACNDAEADLEEGGVDPLCLRYDIEKDPTRSIETAFSRIVQSSLPGDTTVAQALRRVPALVIDAAALASIKDQDDLNEKTAQIAEALDGVLKFYILSGKASFAGTLRVNLKSLLQFSDGVLPEGYDANQMRERVYTGLQRALSFTTLNTGMKEAIQEALQNALDMLEKTPYLESLSPRQSLQVRDEIREKISASIRSFEKDPTGLPKLRAAIFGWLARHPEVPFFLGNVDQVLIDYEARIVQLLADAVTADSGRTDAERIAAATSLATYKTRSQGEAAMSRVLAKLKVERSSATTNSTRELVETLLGILRNWPPNLRFR